MSDEELRWNWNANGIRIDVQLRRLSHIYLFRIIVGWMWWRARGQSSLHTKVWRWIKSGLISIRFYSFCVRLHLTLAAAFAWWTIETLSCVHRLQGHATIIYERIKIIHRIERTRTHAPDRSSILFNVQHSGKSQIEELMFEPSICFYFSCCCRSRDGEWWPGRRADYIVVHEYRNGTVIIIIRYSLSHAIAFDFKVFIKFGLFAILFLIFIGIKLITANAGEDYVRMPLSVQQTQQPPIQMMSFRYRFVSGNNII